MIEFATPDFWTTKVLNMQERPDIDDNEVVLNF